MNSPGNQSQGANNQQGNGNLEIRQARMYNGMKDETTNFISGIFLNFTEEQMNNHQYIAETIKKHMDKLYGPPWHCIVGKGFGSAVTYKNKNFLYLYTFNKAVMIFRH